MKHDAHFLDLEPVDRPLRIFVDMDNVLVDFSSAIAGLSSETLNEYEGRLDEVPGIFARMSPMTGAVEAFIELSRQAELFILSTSPWNNPSAWSDKLQWVQKYLGEPAYKRLILSHHKELMSGDYLIDDRYANGAFDFDGELIRFGSERFPDWESIRSYLKSQSARDLAGRAAGKSKRYPEELFEEAHKKTFKNEEVILNSKLCVCAHCGYSFRPEDEDLDFMAEIEGETIRTLYCPKCGVDAVLGSASGYPMTRRFFKGFSDHLFGGFSILSREYDGKLEPARS